MSFDLSPQSSLDLHLKGSVGSFKVGAGPDHETLDVKYFLTHVALNFESGSNEKLLKELAPVREIFDFKQLDFDEIMQRDIDDARVSSELIPYILDDKTKDLIKFFPPIVVMVLPVEDDRNKPAPYYPSVSTAKEKLNEHGVEDWLVTRSGEIGAEVFQFKQPVLQNHVHQHDLVTFSLNTSKCRMVIVDGQHRAMALLALYRNLKDQWSDANRQAFESYYLEWTPDHIRKFDLSYINLPMIVCTVPSLDKDYSKDYDLKKACRSVFLTLNKNARKVSRSRNLLLDDNDLISSFMRKVLSSIKNGDRSVLSEDALEIHNVELDQSGDKQKVSSPVALTGVSHLYYMVEHMLLDSGDDINGIAPRAGRFSTRVSGTYFSNALSRLDCLNLLGQDAYSSIRRDVFSTDDEVILGKKFIEVYGANIVKVLAKFSVFAAHNVACISLKESLLRHTDVHLKPMLFDGQGISRVFETHRENLGLKLKEDYFHTDVPKIREIKVQLDATSERLRVAIDAFEKKRAKNYLDRLMNKEILDESGDVKGLLVKIVSELFGNVFTTVAFQTALICGFYTEFEKASEDFEGGLELDLDEIFDEYLIQMSSYFLPQSFTQFKSLLSILKGHTSGDSTDELRILEGSPETFRNVVFPGEMQPDQWPKYRYLLLEIWRPTNEDLAHRINAEREKCRKQVFKAHYDRQNKKYLNDNRLLEEELDKTQVDDIFKASYDTYRSFLKLMGRASEITEGNMKDALRNQPLVNGD